MSDKRDGTDYSARTAVWTVVGLLMPGRRWTADPSTAVYDSDFRPVRLRRHALKFEELHLVLATSHNRRFLDSRKVPLCSPIQRSPARREWKKSTKWQKVVSTPF